MKYLMSALASEGRTDDRFLVPLLTRALEELCFREFDEKEVGVLVAVVPMRETEAWMLADGDALRASFGVSWTNNALGVPSQPGQVEGITDPKATLQTLESRLNRPISAYMESLGNTVSLEVLMRVPAFGRWWADTREALVASGFRPSKGL